MGRRDDQVTPFNAGDPIMPSGDPVGWGSAGLFTSRSSKKADADPQARADAATNPSVFADTDADIDAYASALASADADMNADADAFVTASATASGAPLPPDADAAAPSFSDEKPLEPASSPRKARRRARRNRKKRHEPTSPATPNARKTKKGNVIIWVVILCLALGMSSSAVTSCVEGFMDAASSAVDGFTQGIASTEDPEPYESFETDDEDLLDTSADTYKLEEDFETLTHDRAEQLLASLASQDEANLGQVAEGFSDAFETYLGFSPQEIGVDPEEAARWLLSGITYNVDSAYAFASSSGDEYECSSYASVSAPDLYGVLFDLYDFMQLDLHVTEPSNLAADDKTALGEEFERLCEELPMYDHYASMHFTGTVDGQSNLMLELDQEDWDAQARSILGFS